MKVKSFVGGHDLHIYSGCEYDPAIRKYRKGSLSAVIPYSGRTLSARLSQDSAEPIEIEGKQIPTLTPQKFESVDPLPDTDECDYCIVSAMYVAACQSLGLDTSRLLTIGLPVVNEEGHTVGCCALNRN